MLEQMASTNAGWTGLRFDEIAENVTERVQPGPDDNETYVGLEHLDSGSLRVRRWGSEVALKGTKLRMREGDILFAKRNAYLKRVALAPHDGLFSAHGMVLRAKPDAILPEFLPFFMQSDPFMERALSISVGSLSPTINWTALAKEEFLLPPMQEQARLVETLSAAEQLQSRLYDLESATNTARLSIYLEYFLTDRRAKANARVGDVATVRNGTTPSRKNPDFWEGDVPWLPTGKVNERYITAPDEFITQQALAKCSLRLVPAKSTLVAMIGQGTTRGKSAFLEIESTINQNFAAVTPGPDILPEFLFYQLDACYEPLRHWSHGSNQHALNTKLVAEFPIWVPDKNTQREITNAVSQLEIEVRRASARRESFRNVYDRIANQAFLEG